MKRALSVFLAAALLAGCIVMPAGAAYSDLAESHWAYEDMTRASRLGVINGVGGGRMAPDDTLTWAQFLTMLCRAFSPPVYRQAAADGLSWDAAGYRSALDTGVLLLYDFLPVYEDSLHTPLTRADAAALLARVLPDGLQPHASAPVEEIFSDCGGLHGGYLPAIELLYGLDIIRGKGDGSFGPGDTLRRCDGTVLLMRTLALKDYALRGEPIYLTLNFIDAEGTPVASRGAEARIGEVLDFIAEEHLPEGWKLREYPWLSVSSAQDVYSLVCERMTQTELEADSARERYFGGEISDEEFFGMDFWLRTPGYNTAKGKLLFGDESKWSFDSREEAEAHMVSVSVPVWRLSDGKKTSGKATLTVHEALADEVVAIFTEIYNDSEQFPILNVGGYGWRSSATSEHSCGTAIDINYEQNYQIRGEQVLAGSYWRPYEDPYSITPDGSVVRIFEAHGWSWGGTAWESNRDYMHFSYMGR